MSNLKIDFVFWATVYVQIVDAQFLEVIVTFHYIQSVIHKCLCTRRPVACGITYLLTAQYSYVHCIFISEPAP